LFRVAKEEDGIDKSTLFVRDVVTLARYQNRGKPTPTQLLNAIDIVARENRGFRFSDLRDRHYQFIANHFQHLPLTSDSMESFKKAVSVKFASVHHPPPMRELSHDVDEDTRTEESMSSDNDSFTVSDSETDYPSASESERKEEEREEREETNVKEREEDEDSVEEEHI
jgi:hypothetical protein